MKDSIKILMIFFCSSVMTAQVSELWGLADIAGTNTKGIIFKTNLDGTGYTIVDTLKGIKGGTAPGNLIRAINGTLYGMTLNGGANNLGVVFSYDVFTSTFSKIIDFNGSNGKSPFGSLVQASDGKLYGMTQAGGAYGKGVIFSVDPNNNSFTKLYDLTILTGAIPAGNLVQASNGLLYGMTSSGGIYGYGTVFSFNPTNNAFVKLHHFNGTDGKSPLGSLVEASNGKLYGMTYLGGSYTKGAIFNYDITATTYSVIVNFNGSGGQNPIGSMVLAADGKLYGMTPNGGTSNSGIIFSIETSSNTFTKEYNFNGGAGPNGSLMQASNNKLYGLTETGGTNGKGNIFSFNLSNKVVTDLYDFSTSSYGYNPSGDLLEVQPVKVIVPNIFSPNGDKINDEFFVSTYGVTKISCDIFNRWGQHVISLSDTTQKWNGKMSNGDDASNGTYYYIINADTYDKKSHVQKGDLLLVK